MNARVRKIGVTGVASAALAAACLLAAPVDVLAQTRPVVSAGEAARASQIAPSRRALRLDRSGRWSVDFSLDPSTSRPDRVGDVGAGAYYRVNPRLSVGASAGLVEGPVDPGRPAQSDRNAAPRVRLESTFRF
ncbi:NtrZ family periplasmic regulatory protein [Brevundimonas sp.]|jgi:HAMP domain-containing protein|uniref:NtrZ family periplasmic regulatory protein n=1 Tax=Brevundimonas sp. TaxID=1871086 RepID=UPI002E12DEAB|nr:hypothetical protein [Brevundimonas sp.]